MKGNCKYCGFVGSLNELILMPDDKYMCLSCWNLRKTQRANEEIDIKICEDGIPAIILPLNILCTIESYDAEYFTDEFYIEGYYCQIMEETGLTREELDIMVKAKIKEYRNLVSEETALIMVADKLGLKIKRKH